MRNFFLFLFLLLAGCQQDKEAQPDISMQIDRLHDYLKADLYAQAKAATPQAAPDLGNIGHLETPLTVQQIELAQPFIDKVWNIESTNGVADMVDSYESAVLASSLTDRQKWELITIGESVRVAAEFVDEGGMSIVYNTVAQSAQTDAVYDLSRRPRTPDPNSLTCIQIRTLMQGAVFSGFVGAGVGGFIGATAGSFTVPIIGTATGAVGGAVYGFAQGFFGGVAGGLAQQFIFDCMFGSAVSSVKEQAAPVERLILIPS